ncbi:MAG TPA: hypothetical protein VHY20_07450, partial [Pirellulales bacterium]|nr:hypothetical protein [Pirellulales bacterium]
AHTIGDQAEDTAEIALSSTAASSPSAADDDGELHFAPAGEAEGDFDPFADGAPTAADDLADLGGADDEPSPAPRGADRGKAKAGESAAAKSPAGKSKGKDKDAGGWWPFGKGGKKPDRKSDKSQIEPASAAAEIEQPEPQPAVVQPAASDDDVLDFFEDTPPAAAQPAAAQPAASDDDVLDFFEDTPPAAAKPAAAKPTAAKPAAAKPAPAKPAAAAPAPAKSAADEPDLDFLGSGSDAAAKPSEEDDGLTDFLQDLGLN